MVILCRIFRTEDYQKILEFYKRVDSEYFPMLSERRGGLEGHILTILNNRGTFVLYEVDGSLKGAAGFFPFDKEKSVVQFTFFTFIKELQNSLAPYRLAKYLAQKRDELGYSSTKKIIARTWYEESADRLERMGFIQVAAIQGDIIPERTSYYFEGNLDFICENIFNRKTVPRKLKQ